MAERTTEQLHSRLRLLMQAREDMAPEDWAMEYGDEMAQLYGELDRRLSGLYDFLPQDWRWAQTPVMPTLDRV